LPTSSAPPPAVGARRLRWRGEREDPHWRGAALGAWGGAAAGIHRHHQRGEREEPRRVEREMSAASGVSDCVRAAG
jgi:hypothetical protein